MIWKCVCGQWLKDDSIADYVNCPHCNQLWWKRQEFKISHCWGYECNSRQINRFGLEDSPYGHYCPTCDRSLRFHPYFGMGMEYDKGNSMKWTAWKNLSRQQKNEVRKRYGFN